MRRMSLAIMATVVGVLGATSVASAAGPVQDGQFNLTFSSGKIVIADLASTDIPAGNTVNVLGNVDPTGKVALPKSALQFPPLPVDALPGVTLTVSIAQTKRSDGQIDPVTGATSLPLSVAINIASDLGNCKIPLDLSFTTGTQSVTGSKSVVGSPYDPATGAITLAGVAPIPVLANLSAVDCPLKDLIGGLIPSGANGNIGLQLAGLLAMPGGPKYPDPADDNTTPPDPCVVNPASCVKPPPALANPIASFSGSSLKSTKGSIAVPIACAGTATTAKPCSGKATLTSKVTTITTKKVKGKKKKIKKTKTVTLGSATYNAAAGATATPKIKLSSANQKLLKAAKNKLKATLNVTNTGGTGVTNKSVTIKG